MIPNKDRVTSQEIIILDHLRTVKTHPTAEMVYEAVKKRLPTISRGTVYRNLLKLYTQGRIRRIEVNGVYRFEGDMAPHLHAVCTSCGKMLDSFLPQIPKYALGHFRDAGFSPTGVTIIYEGYCKACAGKGNKSEVREKRATQKRKPENLIKKGG